MTEVYLTLAAQVVAFVVWIVRIEMRVKFLQESHDLCRVTRERAELSTIDKLDQIGTAIAELKTDIKWLVASQVKNGNGFTNHHEPDA